MAIWLVLIAVLLICLAINYYKWSRDPLTIIYNKIPGPKGYPFFGTLPNMSKDSASTYFKPLFQNFWDEKYKFYLLYHSSSITACPSRFGKKIWNHFSHVALAATSDLYNFAQGSRGTLNYSINKLMISTLVDLIFSIYDYITIYSNLWATMVSMSKGSLTTLFDHLLENP